MTRQGAPAPLVALAALLLPVAPAVAASGVLVFGPTVVSDGNPNTRIDGFHVGLRRGVRGGADDRGTGGQAGDRVARVARGITFNFDIHGNFLEQVAKFRAGLANPEDIDYLRDLSATIIETSRCGLGMTSPNPILSTLDNFPLVYSAMVKPSKDGIRATFDIQSAIDGARHLAKRRSYIYDEDFSK